MKELFLIKEIKARFHLLINFFLKTIHVGVIEIKILSMDEVHIYLNFQKKILNKIYKN